jgi:hypothetical protein
MCVAAVPIRRQRPDAKGAAMFAILAALVFLLQLLDIGLGPVNLTALGLFLVALHLAIGVGVPALRR